MSEALWNTIEDYDWPEDEILVIEKKGAYCMDITANGKRIVPILRKIEKAMTEAGLAGETGVYAGWFGEWANNLTDRQDRKYFIWNYSGRQDIENGCWSYSWGIEQIDDDHWYIFLNIAKPQEETEEPQETEEQTTKEEQSMTKNEAIREIAHLDAGTLARIFGSPKYEVIDDGINRMIITADQMEDADFEGCRNWIDVLHTINRWSECKNWYLTGNADYREYLVKYGRDEAVVILNSYIETITKEGIADTKPEQDYIRGAKDMLAIR